MARRSGWSLILSSLVLLSLSGCKEDDASLMAFFKDMSDVVQVEFASADVAQDPCLLANGRAAAKWYAGISERHRQYLKYNVQKFVRAVRLEKTRILSGVPTSVANTAVYYDRGTLIVESRGVLTENNEIVCDPDIDILVDLTVERSLSLAAGETASNAQLH